MLKYMDFFKDVHGPSKMDIAEFDVLFYLGTIVQEQYVHYYISSLRTEIVCKTQGIIKR